jgi:hypothetical protein
MFKSLNDARFTMWATVIPRLDSPSTATGDQPSAGPGRFERRQDPDSGQMISVWVPDTTPGVVATNSNSPQYEIQCYARGYTDLGYRSSGNREIYVKGEYNVTEAIQFDYSASVLLNHQTLITNIRTSPDATDTKSYSWLYEDDPTQSIVWEVQGVTPVHDPFGKLIRNTTVLKRAEIQ